MRTIKTVMSDDLYTLKKNDTLQTARLLMVARHIHHVPIVNRHQEVLGLVSHRDILAASSSKLEEVTEEEVSHQNKIKLAELMSTDIYTLSPEDDLLEAAKHFQKNKGGCIPITDNGALVGVLTSYDFIQLAVECLES